MPTKHIVLIGYVLTHMFCTLVGLNPRELSVLTVVSYLIFQSAVIMEIFSQRYTLEPLSKYIFWTLVICCSWAIFFRLIV